MTREEILTRLRELLRSREKLRPRHDPPGRGFDDRRRSGRRRGKGAKPLEHQNVFENSSKISASKPGPEHLHD